MTLFLNLFAYAVQLALLLVILYAGWRIWRAVATAQAQSAAAGTAFALPLRAVAVWLIVALVASVALVRAPVWMPRNSTVQPVAQNPIVQSNTARAQDPRPVVVDAAPVSTNAERAAARDAAAAQAKSTFQDLPPSE